MIIDLGHPVAAHLLDLREGVPLPRVRSVDTERKVATVHDGSGFEATEVQYDDLVLGSDTPLHLRGLLPGVRALDEDETLPRPYVPEYPLVEGVKQDLRDKPYGFKVD